MTKNRFLLGAAMLAALTLGQFASGAALAQDTPAQPSPAAQPINGGLGLETVIVTARKREENIQSVPISITALTQDDLDRLSIRTIEDLRYVSPSVYIAPTTFRQDTLNVTIRGQRDIDSSSGQSVMSFDTAASVYMDGVYMARPVGLSAALFDIEQVQVLKGPQGTLVGRNSTGGAILYQTREPGDKFGGYLQTTGGDHVRGEIQGAINIPLADNLFFRAAGQISNAKGYIQNYYFDPATGYRNNQPAMGSNKIAGNFSLKWLVDDSFSVLLRANISAEHDTGSTYHDLGYFPGSGLRNGKTAICNIPGSCTGFTDLLGHVIAPYYTTVTLAGASGVSTNPAAYNSLLASIAREKNYGFWSTEQTVSNLDVGHYQTVSGVVNKSFPDGTNVKWLTAYRWWDNRGTSVGRGLPYDTANYEYQVPDYRSFQSEVTVNGAALDGRLKWTTGLFFFQENSPKDGGLFYLYLPSAVTPAPVTNRQITLQDGTQNGQRNTSYAGYAQATYAILPDTRVTAGLRYTYDERSAYLALKSITTPSTAVAPGPFAPYGQFSATPFVLNGISYSGQTTACALTDVNGKPLPLAACAVNVNSSYHKPTYTLAVDHDLWDGMMVYATMRSGYRSGAINSAAIQPAAFKAKPEDVTDYEVGVKSDWNVLGMPLRTNFSAYYSHYHNLQVLATLPNITVASVAGGGPCTQAAFSANACLNTTNDPLTLNANKARIYGAEWEITLKPIPQLTLSSSGSYLDARYVDYTVNAPAGYLPPAGTRNLSGTPFPLPRWQTNATAIFASGLHDIAGIPVDDVTFTAHYYWQSRTLADLRAFDPSQKTSSYGFLNLRLDILNVADKGMDVSAFLNNAINTPACLPEYNGVLNSAPNASFGIPNTAGALQCVPLPPRMAGLTLRYRF